MKLIRFSFIAAACALLINTASAQTALSTTAVDWFNTNGTLLLNASGTALSAGTSANNDGALIQLGYYNAATAANPFAGSWVALTGAGPLLTTIGDSRDGTGLPAGRFDFTTIWHHNSNVVDVYDPTFGDIPYTTQSAVVIGNSSPPAGQILSIRFYDTNTITASTKYNAVSNVNWQWQTPSDAGTNLPAITLTQANLVWESVLPAAGFNLTGTEFRTVLAAIPEPSTFALLGIGIALPLLRRRKV